MHGTHLFGLSNVSQAGLEQWQWLQWQEQLSSFFSVTCCGDAFHRLGVQGVEDLILSGALFPLSVAPESQGGFGVMSVRLSVSIPYLPSWISQF
jgi:hypothetical protein